MGQRFATISKTANVRHPQVPDAVFALEEQPAIERVAPDAMSTHDACTSIVDTATDDVMRSRSEVLVRSSMAEDQLSIWKVSWPAANDTVKPAPETLSALVRLMQIHRLPAELASIKPTD